MNKGLALIILGGLAVIGGAIFAAMVIKNKFSERRNIDFDDFEGYDEFNEFDNSDDEDGLPIDNIKK